MAEIPTETLAELLGKVTPGEWRYRPRPHDDWGMVRAETDHIVAIGRDGGLSNRRDEEGHRERGTDPYEPNARLIALAPELGREVLALRAQVAAVAAVQVAWWEKVIELLDPDAPHDPVKLEQAETLKRCLFALTDALRPPVPEGFYRPAPGEFDCDCGCCCFCTQGLLPIASEGGES